MKNVLKRSDKKFVLIGKIKGLAGEARRARNRILKATSQKSVWALATRKRIVGIDIRHHLLAYAFLKGKSYHSLEKKCAEGNVPNAGSIFDIVMAHAPCYTYREPGSSALVSYTPTLADVNVWLSGAV